MPRKLDNLIDVLLILTDNFIIRFYRFCNITIAIYGALSEIVDHGLEFNFKEIGLIVDTVYCATLLYVFCNCSHRATQRVIIVLNIKMQ